MAATRGSAPRSSRCVGLAPGALGKRDVPQGRPKWRPHRGWHACRHRGAGVGWSGAIGSGSGCLSRPWRAGTVRIETGARLLYLMLGNHQALRYRIGVGRAGRQWAGHSVIAARLLSPHWIPPAKSGATIHYSRRHCWR